MQNTGIWDRIKYHYNEIRKPLPIRSKDEYNKQLDEARDKILEDKEEMTKSFKEKYSYTNIQEHKDNVLKMCYYLFYILLFLTIILLQLRNEDSYSLSIGAEILINKEVIF